MKSLFSKQRLLPLAAGLSLAVVIYFGLSWLVVSLALSADVTEFAYLPEEFGLTFEEIEFSPRHDDAITLRGWWLPNDEAIGTVIFLHGLDKNRAERLPLLSDLVQSGFAVMTFDLRGHGESDRARTGAGSFEKQDIRGAIDFVLEEKGVQPGKLLLLGQSFGAASALLGGVGESALAGVYVDSSFAALDDVMINEIARRTPIPRWLARSLGPGIALMGGWTKGVDIAGTRPVDAAAEYPYRLGIAHCIDDERVRVQDALRIRAVAEGGSWLNLFPGCGHAGAYDRFTEQYTAIVTNYFLERLGLLEQ